MIVQDTLVEQGGAHIETAMFYAYILNKNYFGDL